MSGHGGNLRALAEQLESRFDDILDFSANINPLGPPANLSAVINHHLDNLIHYPDPEYGISSLHGETLLSFKDGSGCGMKDGSGCGMENDRVWGSYLHGIFDNDDFRRWWINRLRQNRGLAPLVRGAVYDLEPALDRLADTVRASVDMDKIYQLLDL